MYGKLKGKAKERLNTMIDKNDIFFYAFFVSIKNIAENTDRSRKYTLHKHKKKKIDETISFIKS